MIITIDGPAASGKGTLARALAAELGFAHLDTGSLYRALALQVLAAGIAPEDESAVTQCAQNFDMAYGHDPKLRAQATGQTASIISRYKGVRAALLAAQRSFAESPPGDAKGAILDGRDAGSVVCPHADVKLYVEASSRERARRRFAELEASGQKADLASIQAEIEKRDHQDQTRQEAPLIVPTGAHLLDTTQMSIEAALVAALDIISKASRA